VIVGVGHCRHRRPTTSRLAGRRSTATRRPAPTGATKVTCTELAFQVADEALQLFGGNGLTREYPLEKLFRDARAARIEDGENNLLSMKFGYLTTLLQRSGQLGS